MLILIIVSTFRLDNVEQTMAQRGRDDGLLVRGTVVRNSYPVKCHLGHSVRKISSIRGFLSSDVRGKKLL